MEVCSSGIQQMPLRKKHEVKLAFSVLQLKTINEPHSYESEVMEKGDRYFAQKKIKNDSEEAGNIHTVGLATVTSLT